MNSAPHWTAYAKLVVALLSALIAAEVAYRFGNIQASIARQPAETASNKLRLDLFDRRLVICDAFISAWSRAVSSGGFGDKAMNEYFIGTIGVRWLFEDAVVQYVEMDFLTTLFALDEGNAGVENARDQAQRVDQVKKRSVIFERVRDERSRIHEIFAPYLALRH